MINLVTVRLVTVMLVRTNGLVMARLVTDRLGRRVTVGLVTDGSRSGWSRTRPAHTPPLAPPLPHPFCLPSFPRAQEKTLMKLVVDGATDKVLGVHMVGAEAGEIIQLAGVCLKASGERERGREGERER